MLLLFISPDLSFPSAASSHDHFSLSKNLFSDHLMIIVRGVVFVTAAFQWFLERDTGFEFFKYNCWCFEQDRTGLITCILERGRTSLDR